MDNQKGGHKSRKIIFAVVILILLLTTATGLFIYFTKKSSPDIAAYTESIHPDYDTYNQIVTKKLQSILSATDENRIQNAIAYLDSEIATYQSFIIQFLLLEHKHDVYQNDQQYQQAVDVMQSVNINRLSDSQRLSYHQRLYLSYYHLHNAHAANYHFTESKRLEETSEAGQ